jgi:uncharacterized protein YbjT (DUF2867 family)
MLITGATGKTGSATVMELRKRGFAVRALVHTIDQRSQRLRDAGAEIVVGSLEDYDALVAALRGVQRAYFCPPLASGALRKATLFAAAAEEAKLEAVVALTQWLVDPSHRALHSREKWLAERVLERSKFGLVIVNPGFFADNYLAGLEPIAQLGLFGMPLGEGRNAPPSNEDIAKVIVGAMTNPAPHLGKRYRPTGPRLLSPVEIAETFARVLGRPVRYRPAPLPLFLKVARTLGFSDYVLVQLHAFLQDYQRDSFAVGAPTDAVEVAGGAAPESFESIVRRYVASSTLARPSLRGRLRAIANVLRALMATPPRLDEISARLELPEPSSLRLAADSPRWLTTHAVSSR